MLSVPAGKLRHHVDFQKPDPSSPRDSAGQVLTNWLTAVRNVPAAIEPLEGREALTAAQRQASTTHKITTRWSHALAVVDANYRIKFGTRIFTLDERPRNTEERNIELVLMCTERTPKT